MKTKVTNYLLTTNHELVETILKGRRAFLVVKKKKEVLVHVKK